MMFNEVPDSVFIDSFSFFSVFVFIQATNIIFLKLGGKTLTVKSHWATDPHLA